jgi:alkylation response protein AidB-like acyl-CoA dehydrogenase
MMAPSDSLGTAEAVTTSHEGAAVFDLSTDEQEIVRVVAEFVDDEVRPAARDLEREDSYPEHLVDRMKQLGIYGMCVPSPYGESAVSVPCFALVTEEVCRGWMSLGGAFGGHSVVCRLIDRFGTDEQRSHWLPKLATGEVRATMALTEPQGGSDLQGITTVARRTSDGYVVNGRKTWITNARHAGVTALLCKTDPSASPAHVGISILLVEPGAGVTVSRDLEKLGYRGVESCEIAYDDAQVPADALLGGVEGQGFAQMMAGLELGRIQVAARAVGVARAAYEDALGYAQVRETFGKPIWQHQSVGNLLADMATGVEAARLLTLSAAERLERGQRCDLEAGMAKLFASETCLRVTTDAIRVHGGYGYSPEYDVERYFRDAPLMVVGEGTNEIQRQVIARQLVARRRG